VKKKMRASGANLVLLLYIGTVRRSIMAMKSMTEVYNEWVGRAVVVTGVDLWGFTGRERHPEKSDIGQVGVVTDVLEIGDFEDYLNDAWYCALVVQFSNGRVLELIDHELDVIENICAA
jgi:hypothetical protein